jgi:hypothetical protein
LKLATPETLGVLKHLSPGSLADLGEVLGTVGHLVNGPDTHPVPLNSLGTWRFLSSAPTNLADRLYVVRTAGLEPAQGFLPEGF